MTPSPDGDDSEADAGNAGDAETERTASDSDADTSPDAPAGPECPFCGSTATERESRFGSEISKAQYYCTACRTVFERIKYDGERADTRRPE